MSGTRFHQWLVISLFLILMGLLVSTQAPLVHAATITVNDLGDSLTLGSCSTTGTGTCTLREAITFANSNPGADTINFSVSGTITLIFTLTKSTEALTIDGTGQNVIVDGVDTHLTMQAAAGAPLTLKYLTFTHSYNPGSGGAIAADDTLNLDHVTAQNSNADGFGGGAYAKLTAVISNSTFTGNKALKGGGALFDGTANINDTTFSSNSTTDAVNEPSGGGAYFNNAATLTNVTFDSNTAGSAANTSGAGGAAFVLGANVTGGAFTNNTGNFAGGGAYFGGAATVNGTTFFNNQAKTNRGGGAYFNGSANVQNALFNGNQTLADVGGGAYFKSAAGVNATSFITNTASDRAGGAYFFATAALTDTNFYTNTATVLGGGGYFGGTQTDILNGVLQGNQCTNTCSGGGAYIEGQNNITGTKILTNTTDSSGGGIATNNNTTITDAILQGNESTGGAGGGLGANAGTLIISHTLVINNKANSVNGGGGGIGGGALTGIINSTLHGNTGYAGGAIGNAGLMFVFNSTIDNNTAAAGGGIFNMGQVIAVNTTFDNNAATSGGGIAALTTYQTGLVNVTLANSTQGGGIVILTSPQKNIPLSKLKLPKPAGPLSPERLRSMPEFSHLPELPSATTTLSMNNTILSNNTGGDCTNNGAIVDADSSLISDGLTCVNGINTNNLTGTPYLKALADNGGPTTTMALEKYSPAIDSGNSNTCIATLLQNTDQRGELRDDLQCDIGAFELKFSDSPSVTRLDLPVGATQTYGPTLAKIKLASGTLVDLTVLLTKGAPANTPPANALPLQWDLTNVCYLCNKTDTPQKPTVYALDVSFCYDPSILSGQNENNLHVYHYNGSTWDDLGGTLDTATYTSYHCVAATSSVSTLSPFILAPTQSTAVNVTGVKGAANKHGNVAIRWKTTTESELAGFNVYRKSGNGEWKKINAALLQAKHAGSADGDKYRFTDKTVRPARTYHYKIEVVYLDNHSEWTRILRVKTP